MKITSAWRVLKTMVHPRGILKYSLWEAQYKALDAIIADHEENKKRQSECVRRHWPTILSMVRD